MAGSGQRPIALAGRGSGGRLFPPPPELSASIISIFGVLIGSINCPFGQLMFPIIFRRYDSRSGSPQLSFFVSGQWSSIGYMNATPPSDRKALVV
jgi:hypothetical protein